MLSEYWEHAPENLKRAESKRKGVRKKSSQIQDDTKCKNPFHYLTKIANLSNQKLTKCHCSHVKARPKLSKTTDIRSCFQKISKSHTVNPKRKREETTAMSKNQDSLDTKHTVPNQPVYTALFDSQSDVIRREHDRAKKHKSSSSHLKSDRAESHLSSESVLHHPMSK